LFGTGFLLFCLAVIPSFAQGYRSPLESNKKVVAEFYRLVFEPRNTDLLEQFVAEDFVEHSPGLPNGRDNLAKLIKSLPAPPNDDVGPALRNAPALIAAEGDLVTYIFEQTQPDPGDATKTYERFSFDAFRVKNGRIVEHWDSDVKPAKR
jgi:predicted SnoaL-like aldol condensation-catalyzing enzyme